MSHAVNVDVVLAGPYRIHRGAATPFGARRASGVYVRTRVSVTFRPAVTCQRTGNNESTSMNSVWRACAEPSRPYVFGGHENGALNPRTVRPSICVVSPLTAGTPPVRTSN